jgi:methionine-rich copper-binding protein CopC
VPWRLAAALLLMASPVWAHAFPDHSDPRVGHTVEAPPPVVRIWFDGEIEPVFSTIRVEDGHNGRVDKGDGQASAASAHWATTVLERVRKITTLEWVIR